MNQEINRFKSRRWCIKNNKGALIHDHYGRYIASTYTRITSTDNEILMYARKPLKLKKAPLTLVIKTNGKPRYRVAKVYVIKYGKLKNGQ